jgi:hypothetical protein
MIIQNLKVLRFVKQFCILSSLFVFSLSSIAQDSVTVKHKWNFLIEPYILFPNMKGTIGLGTLPDASLDVNSSDIFSHFKMGALLYFEAAKDRWAFTSDLIYMNLGEDVQPGTLISSGDVTVKQLSWEVAGLRKLTPWLEGGIGLRLNNINSEANLLTKNIGGGTTDRSKSLTETWVDPVIIARIKSSTDKKFIYQFRGDIGGFSIGSDFAWQMQAYGGYRFSKLFQVTAGYRVISVDYKNGSGENRFLYDIDTFGPVVRFGFNF